MENARLKLSRASQSLKLRDDVISSQGSSLAAICSVVSLIIGFSRFAAQFSEAEAIQIVRDARQEEVRGPIMVGGGLVGPFVGLSQVKGLSRWQG